MRHPPQSPAGPPCQCRAAASSASPSRSCVSACSREPATTATRARTGTAPLSLARWCRSASARWWCDRPLCPDPPPGIPRFSSIRLFNEVARCGPTAEGPPVPDDESTRQVCRRMRSIAATATPKTAATWAAVMPYSAQTRMRANCERGISVVIRSSEMAGGSPCSRRTGGGGNALRMRGFRPDGSAGGTESGTGCQ
jgi:hypothetical protein